MSLLKISIRDKMFSHAFSTSNWFKPTLFEWDFKELHNDYIFFTDLSVGEVENIEFANFKKYAWLVESQAVTPNSYKFVAENHKIFDKIFTHSKELSQLPNAYIVPIGGCHLTEDEIGLKYEKSNLVSMMYSNKLFAPGHIMRHDVASNFANVVDVMGSGVDGKHVSKIHSCRDYAFSIVIENNKDGYYFTEKIIDCFLTGVIPIYWGSPHISDYFNKNGIIEFDTLDQVYEILKYPEKLVEYYNSNSSAIIENRR
jgi:Glycosyltransferase family 10 (fucosyltransferase) C-term